MTSKVRPVGSPVPKPKSVDNVALPWADGYQTLFTGSGTEALSLGVKAAIRNKPDVSVPEVVIPAYGCPDLIAAILAQGAHPVMVDLVKGQPVMDDQRLVEALSSQTVAVVGVNFLGIPERWSILSQICRRNSLYLIEDSAQSFPPFSAESELADVVVLSFGRGKPINLMGGGALLVRNDRAGREELSDLESGLTSVEVNLGPIWRIKRFIFNLLLSRYLYPVLESLPFLGIGQTHFRALQSVSLLGMPRALLAGGIDAYQRRRPPQKIYGQKLAFLEAHGWKQLTDTCSANSSPALRYALLAPCCESREKALTELNRSGIGANAFYGKPLSDFVDPEKLGIRQHAEFPRAAAFAERLLVLPAHDDVSDKDVSVIVDAFRRVTAGRQNSCSQRT